LKDHSQGWRQLKWGDLATLEYGKALRGYQAVKAKYPVYGTNGLIGWHDTALCKRPGIIIGRKGAYRGVHLSKTPFFVIDTAFYLKLFSDDVDLSWAFYQLINFDINNVDSGSAIPSTSREAFYQIPVSLPSLPTQRKIAAILSAYDDLVENNTCRIAILEEMAHSLFREWFVHFRFPGHEKKSMVESELGMIPEGWEVVKLGDALTLQRGFDLPTSQRREGNVLVYAATGPNGTHDVAKVKGPGVVTGRSGSLGTVIYITDDFWPLNTTLWIKEYRLVTPIYAFYLLSSIELNTFNSGVAVPTLNRNDVHKVQVIIPPRALIDLFDSNIAPLFAMKKSLIQKNINLRRTRDLLLPRLISGEIDVEGLDIGTGEEMSAVAASTEPVQVEEVVLAAEQATLWG